MGNINNFPSFSRVWDGEKSLTLSTDDIIILYMAARRNECEAISILLICPAFIFYCVLKHWCRILKRHSHFQHHSNDVCVCNVCMAYVFVHIVYVMCRIYYIEINNHLSCCRCALAMYNADYVNSCVCVCVYRIHAHNNAFNCQ